MIIRNAILSDIPEIQQIYAYEVENNTATFEEIAPTIQEMEQRFQNITAKAYPYLVLELDGQVVGYAYAYSFKERSAYRFTIENSIYLHKDYHGRGLGVILLTALLEKCKQDGYEQVLAVITAGVDTPSIKLHSKFGFEMVGTMKKVGYKFDKVLDVAIMQLDLQGWVNDKIK